MRSRHEQRKRWGDRAADAVMRIVGSAGFVAVHALVVAGWVVVNSGVVPGVRPFDRFPFSILALLCAVESIFVSTFVLIGENRMTELADRRADLDLQINMLAEHELTKLLGVVDQIAAKLGIDTAERDELRALKAEVVPERVLDEIENAEDEKEGAEQARARRDAGPDARGHAR